MQNVANFPREYFKVESISYFPQPIQNPLYSRPYVVSPDGNAIAVLSDKLERENRSKLTGSFLSDVAPDIIAPSATAFGTPINQGFLSDKRYLFMIKVVNVGFSSLETVYYVQGHTNYDGIGANSVDPHLVHHVDSIIETVVQRGVNHVGHEYRREILSKIYDVVKGSLQYDVYLQRPKDIIDNLSLQGTINDVQGRVPDFFMGDGSSTIPGFGGVADFSYSAGTIIRSASDKVVTSRIENNISSNYLADVINEGVKDTKNKEFKLDTSFEVDTDIINNVGQEASIGSNRFMKKISLLDGFNVTRSEFTFNALMLLDPEGTTNSWRVYNVKKGGADDLLSHTPDVGDYWNGQDAVTLKAYTLIEEGIAMAMANGLSVVHCHFDSTSSPFLSADQTGIITYAKTLINIGDRDKGILLDVFKNRYFQETFLPACRGGALALYCDLYIDLIGVSKIYVEFEGMPGNWYTLPTLYNSYMLPVITPDKQAVDQTAWTISTLVDLVSDTSEDYVEPQLHYPGLGGY